MAQKVMPDHVHLVIQVLEPLPQSIGAQWGGDLYGGHQQG